MRTLAERIQDEGPFTAREAVRLTIRLAKSVAALHACGVAHGRIHPGAVVFTGPTFGTVKLKPSSMVSEDPTYFSPQRDQGWGTSRADDAYAVALLLFYSLTGSSTEAREASGRYAPLAVFDAGDDALDVIVGEALTPDENAHRDVEHLRDALEAWLEDPGSLDLGPLPWDDEEPDRGADGPIDLSSLPPPPEPETPMIEVSTLDEKLMSHLRWEIDDDRETLPGEHAVPPTSRPPRLVPPKIARRKKPRQEDVVSVPPFEHTPAPSSDRTDLGPPPSAGSRGGKRALVVGAALVAAGAAAVVGVARHLDEPVEPRIAPVVARDESSGTNVSAEVTSVVSTSSAAGSASATTSARSALVTTSAPMTSTLRSPSAAPVPLPSSSAAAAPVKDASSCVRDALASDTFIALPSDLGFVCAEADVVRGAAQLRSRIVLAGNGRPVTNGMKEWAMLGFYELAVFAAIRDACCSPLDPATSPTSPATCSTTMQDAVRRVSKARTEDERALDAALDDLDKAIRCIRHAQQSKAFGAHPRPSGGEGTVLRRILKRLPAKRRPLEE